MFRCLSAVLFFIALLLGASSAGVAVPIPSGQDAPTKAAWIKQLSVWQLRWVEFYGAHPRSQEGPRPGYRLPRGRREEFRPRFAVR